MTTREQWARVDAALDEILALPRAAWAAACARVRDEQLRCEIESLLANMDGMDPILDFPAGGAPLTEDHQGGAVDDAHTGLAAGTRIGAYRVVELLGRGGMGEVYRAQRADGQFEQEVAIKLMRAEIGGRPQRFHAERQILARLEHPNIARLHDGGVTADGRPYMVMELVIGRPITRWCEDHRSGPRERLHLFLAVCEAVAYAHRNLVVHRDLKPGNVLVTKDGTVKLVDFGVARLLDGAPSEETQHAAMTPGYAAPEQLSGGQITTATDVYALGMLLFELLTGANPWGDDEISIAALITRVLQQDVPLASKYAARSGKGPVPVKLLSGDLDAIIAKAVRKEPESRYESVNLLHTDISRTLRSEPVSARTGARWYVAGRFLRRHRWGAAAAATVAAAILAAAGGIAWQGQVARREAARALAVKNFLVSVFKASDPRIASNKPRGQITAKELLDGSVGRIEHDFTGHPDLQLELLGVADDIYGYLLDDDRYEALMKQRVTLARRLYGEHHPVVIEGAITEAWASIYTQDFATANRELVRADALLHEAHLDGSALRAEWWLAKERAMETTPDTAAARRRALDQAIELFAKYDPKNASYPAALANAALQRYVNAEYPDAASYGSRAIRIAESLDEHDDADLAVMYGNQADALARLGRFDEARHAYDRAADLARRTNGEQYGTYWRVMSKHASMIYEHGDRAEALAMFAAMLAVIPPDWKATTDDTLSREDYAACLTREGRAAESVPLLEAALEVVKARPRHDFDVRSAEELLGDAYDAVGRTDDARSSLQAALEDYAAHEPGSRPAALEARERWARFLIDHPRGAQDEADARATLSGLLKDAASSARYTAAPARAQADLAKLELRRADAAAAFQRIQFAEAALRDIQAVYDVRVAEEILLMRAEVLVALQRIPEARAAAGQALAQALRHGPAQGANSLRARAILARLPTPLT